MREYSGDSVTIMCCSSCNTKCSHCYLGYKGNINDEVLYDMVRKLSLKYKVDLNGSELLLNEGYIRSLDYLGQERVLTNGIVIHNNDNLINKLKDSSIEWICMSYHFALHDMVSKVSKEIVLDNIKKLKKLGFKIEIMTTISSINLYDIEEMVKEAILMGADCIRFTNYMHKGNSQVMMDDSFVLSPIEISDFFSQFYSARDEYRDYISIKRSGTFGRDYNKKVSSFCCPAGVNKVAITPDFKVYPCPFIIKDGMDIGVYEDGHIYIDKEYEYDSRECLVDKVINRKLVLTRGNNNGENNR